jgi:hypothetical protein
MYAHIMHPEPYFSNTTWVTNNVFNGTGLTEDEINAIYNDPTLGMSTERNLTVWIAASFGDAEAMAQL